MENSDRAALSNLTERFGAGPFALKDDFYASDRGLRVGDSEEHFLDLYADKTFPAYLKRKFRTALYDEFYLFRSSEFHTFYAFSGGTLPLQHCFVGFSSCTDDGHPNIVRRHI